MSSFFSGLRSALTRATSYGSATSGQSSHEAPEAEETPSDLGQEEKPPKKDAFVDEDSFMRLEPGQGGTSAEDVRSSDGSQAASSRTLSIDDESAPSKHNEAGPSTPLNAGSLSTPKTIFQTAQKDVFKSAFKSAAKERDIFMTAKPVRTWDSHRPEDYESSPTVAESVDDSSVTLSFDQASLGTPSVASKRDREEEEDSYVHIGRSTSPKRRRTSQSPGVASRALLVAKMDDEDEHDVPTRYISELDTSALSDDEASGFSSSDSWSLDSAPPGLDHKGRRNWKRQQRRIKSSAMEQIYGTKKPRVGKRPAARSGFRRSVSGRDILIGHARRRFWEGRVEKGVSCY